MTVDNTWPAIVQKIAEIRPDAPIHQEQTAAGLASILSGNPFDHYPAEILGAFNSVNPHIVLDHIELATELAGYTQGTPPDLAAPGAHAAD